MVVVVVAGCLDDWIEFYMCVYLYIYIYEFLFCALILPWESSSCLCNAESCQSDSDSLTAWLHFILKPCRSAMHAVLQECGARSAKIVLWMYGKIYFCKSVGSIQQSWNVRFYVTGIQIEVSWICALCEQNQDLKPWSPEENNLANKNFSQGRSDFCCSLINSNFIGLLQEDYGKCFHSLLLKKHPLLWVPSSCLPISDNVKI